MYASYKKERRDTRLWRLLISRIRLRDVVTDIHLTEELILPESEFPLEHQEKERNIDLAPRPIHRT